MLQIASRKGCIFTVTSCSDIGTASDLARMVVVVVLASSLIQIRPVQLHFSPSLQHVHAVGSKFDVFGLHFLFSGHGKLSPLVVILVVVVGIVPFLHPPPKNN